ARQIFDSRAHPTLEVETEIQTPCSRAKGVASVPSGASTGRYEAYELRDHDDTYHGKNVLKAINGVNGEIYDLLSGQNAQNQLHIDMLLRELDGTENKSRLGANAILATSLSIAKACANAYQMPLWRYLGGAYAHIMPVPLMNVINGGAHSNNQLTLQEFMIVPAGAQSFSDALRMGSEIYHHLYAILQNKGFSCNVGDEGGFAPNIKTTHEALDLLLQAIDKSGFKAGDEVFLALDCASSEYYHKGRYILQGEQLELSSDQHTLWLEQLIKNYPICSIEDGCSENDWDGWTSLTDCLGQHIQLIGDDLFATNAKRIKTGFEKKAANAVLIKPNQIGTLSETLETIYTTQNHGWKAVISHRSGETEDHFIADLAVACNSKQVKFGAIARSERGAKYNQLLRIEEMLGREASFAGKDAIKYAPLS
ncbi:MAG: phosphopyruvate hydratase, partial [Pseudomonadota bacterium]